MEFCSPLLKRSLGTFIIVLAGFTPLSAAEVVPELVAVFPPGCRIGGSVQVSLTGTGLKDATKLVFSRPGIAATRTVDSQFSVQVADTVAAGDCDVWVVTPGGLSNPRRFALGRLAQQNETEPNDTLTRAQAVVAPCTVDGWIDQPVDGDHFRVSFAEGQFVSVECRSLSLDGTVRPTLTLFDPQGTELRHIDGGDVDATLYFMASATGEYTLLVRDRAYRKDAGSFYRLSIITGPRIIAAFPPVLTRGKSADITLYGYELPGALPATLASHPALQQVQAKINAPLHGDADGGGWTAVNAAFLEGFHYKHPQIEGHLRFGITDRDITVASELPGGKDNNDRMETATPITVPCEIAGRFFERGDVDWYRFTAKASVPLVIEGIGERFGRPMDLDLAVHDAYGKLLDVATDTVAPKGQPAVIPMETLDPLITWTPLTDGDHYLAIRDLYGSVLAGPDRAYRLRIAPRLEEFAVVAMPGDEASPRGLSVAAGGNANWQLVALRRGGHQAPIRVRAEGLPLGVTAEEVAIDGKNSTAIWTVCAESGVPSWVGMISLIAETEIEGKPVSSRVVTATPVRAGKPPVVRLTDGLALSVRGKTEQKN